MRREKIIRQLATAVAVPILALLSSIAVTCEAAQPTIQEPLAPPDNFFDPNGVRIRYGGRHRAFARSREDPAGAHGRIFNGRGTRDEAFAELIKQLSAVTGEDEELQCGRNEIPDVLYASLIPAVSL